MNKVVTKSIMIALSLMGSAILLCSCDSGDTAGTAVNEDTLMTEQSENLSIIMSENGRRSYFFKTPMLEGYMLARDPYREFRKGIEITTYQDDSLTTVNAVLTSNYAIYYENRKLWEAKGDVVVVKADGTRLYTQQLFWNSMTKRIYSNVDTKIVKGTDVAFGEGFESDEELKQWQFRRMSGRMFVNMTPTEDEESDAEETADGEAATEGESPETAAAAEDPAAGSSTAETPAAAKSTAEAAPAAVRPEPKPAAQPKRMERPEAEPVERLEATKRVELSNDAIQSEKR